MKVYTSNYIKYFKDQGVQISRTRPIMSRVYKDIEELHPTWYESQEILSGNETPYKNRISRKIQTIIKQLKEGDVLLCWCGDGKNCHRFVVADVLRQYGIEVEEYEL